MYRLPLLLAIAFPLGLLLPGCTQAPFLPAHPPAARLSPALARMLREIPPETSQALVVVSQAAGCSAAAVYLIERQDGEWFAALPAVDAVVGRNGFAADGEKREGDGKTPAGIFPLIRTFGYAASIPTRMAYRQITEDDIWVDDPASPDYNQWMKKGRTAAASFEEMLRGDGLYRCGAVIEYNTRPVVQGMGSAIFLHIWKGKETGTSGCVAMEEAMLMRLLARLEPARNPVAVMGIPPVE
jgi:L,D-peptidoglycan transpeptidase YkuD (ErfK/YbiS/YcfS/YnhG family)